MERAELAQRLGGGADESLGPTLVSSLKPASFMTAFSSAVGGAGDVFLGDPQWSEAQKAVANELILTAAAVGERPREHGWLMIPSGGTSGSVKFARHDQDTIAAAVRGFCAHFELEQVNAVGVLPLHHVSGFMAWMRTRLTGGLYHSWIWSELKQTRFPAVEKNRRWVVSLVPTQLQRLLENPEAIAWLRQFEIIFVGGGPLWSTLTDAAARLELPVSLSYGMTETAAMVTALRPREFLNGARSSGRPLPHVHVTVTPEGLLRVAGESVFRGYFPAWSDSREFTTEDLGALGEQGHLHVHGRRDAVIISGGKKIHPSEVEAALRASGEFVDVAVIGVPDREWGEAVVACYPQASGHEPDVARAVEKLAPHQRPKRFVAIPAGDWPRNEQGKVIRAQLRERASAARR